MSGALKTKRAAELYEPDDVVFDPGHLMHVSLRGRDRGPLELLQHTVASLEGTNNGGTPHLKNRQQTPLDAYFRNNQLVPGDGQDQRRANRAFWVAGRRLRGTWDKAGMKPRLTANLLSSGGGGNQQQLEAPEAMLDHLVALGRAMTAMGPTPRLCVVAVCCTDTWAADWAGRRPWPRPEHAIEILRVGLEALNEYYRQNDRTQVASSAA